MNQLNTAIQVFPGDLIAGLAGAQAPLRGIPARRLPGPPSDRLPNRLS